MTPLPTPRLRWWRAAPALLALALAALLAEGVLAWRAERLAAQLAQRPLPPATAGEPDALKLARALALAEHDDEHALAQYHALAEGAGGDAEGDIAQAARYNAANLLLRQAQKVRQGNMPGQAIALVELAKQGLRSVLRRDPDDWDARYNLERAQRLQPEPDEDDAAPADAPRQAERAVTTMRNWSPGLP